MLGMCDLGCALFRPQEDHSSSIFFHPQVPQRPSSSPFFTSPSLFTSLNFQGSYRRSDLTLSCLLSSFVYFSCGDGVGFSVAWDQGLNPVPALQGRLLTTDNYGNPLIISFVIIKGIEGMNSKLLSISESL